MKNSKTSYLILTLCCCLLSFTAYASNLLEEWGDIQKNSQSSLQKSSVSGYGSVQIDDSTYKRQKSYLDLLDLDVSATNKLPLLRFTYTSKNYLNYNEDSPLRYFIDEVKDFYNSKKPKEVSIDLSNHFFSVIELEEIYNDLQKEKITISSLNLSKTGVDSNVTQILKELLEKESFKYLNISKTPASEVKETFEDLNKQQKNKIIFIDPEYLDVAKKANFDSKIIINHQDYYKIFGGLR